MSFSQEVKEELSKLSNLANKEEVKYEFLGYISSDNTIIENNTIKYTTQIDLEKWLEIQALKILK